MPGKKKSAAKNKPAKAKPGKSKPKAAKPAPAAKRDATPPKPTRAVPPGEPRPTVKAPPSPEARRTTDAAGVRARFTDPLRRFNEHESIRALIESHGATLGDRTFLICEDDGREYSFAALDDRTTRAARVLRECGATDGARVALLMENSPEYVFLLLGAMKSGLIAVPVHSDLSDVQIRFALEDSGAAVLVVDQALWPKVSRYLADLPGLQAVLVNGSREEVDGLRVHRSHKESARVDVLPLIALDGALDAAAPGPLDQRPPRRWDAAELLYPGLRHARGAILQQRQFMTAARWLSVWLRLGSRDRVLNVLPLFHVNAQVAGLFMPLLLGGTMVLSREFNVSRFWRTVERYRVSVIAAVPTMLGILANRELSEARGARGEAPWPATHESPGALGRREDAEAREIGLARAHDISQLRMVVCGSAPLPRATLKAFEQCFLVPVIEGFSMTETTGFASLNPADGTRKIGSVGLGVGNKVAIQDDRFAPRPLEDNWQPTSLARMSPAIFPTANVGEPGEICIWGENVLKEYYQRPSVNPQAFAGGWFHSGDLGRMDSDGFIYVLGSRGQEIWRDGETFMPREIDEVLFGHEQVEQAASIATPDPRRGSLVTTWVVMRKGTFEGGPEDGRLPASEQQQEQMRESLKRWMKHELGEKRQPTTIHFAPRIPQDASGKTRMIDLARMARASGAAPSAHHDAEE
ncbi:MAG: acyl--CoA ligase [Planctomycetes bacterium]|nr:acyl--CoA ligase [Planctomycetota bacterium]